MGLDLINGKRSLRCHHVSSQFQAGKMQANIPNLLWKHAECLRDAAQPQNCEVKDAFKSIQTLHW